MASLWHNANTLAEGKQRFLEDYLEGRAEKIYELEEERIPYWSDSPQGDEKYAVLHPHWGTLFTVNSI